MPSSATRRLDKEAAPLTHLRQARAPVRRHPQRSAPQDNVFFTVETGCCHMANNNEIVLFTSGDGEISLPVNLEEETVWLSQAQMSSLFGKERSVITKHINNVFIEHELVKEGNVQYLHITGSAKPVAFYSLDVIISVGYRVKSQRGVEFRRWATGVLRQYILEGHVENERRLRQLGSIVNIIERIPQRHRIPRAPRYHRELYRSSRTTRSPMGTNALDAAFSYTSSTATASCSAGSKSA